MVDSKSSTLKIMSCYKDQRDKKSVHMESVHRVWYNEVSFKTCCSIKHILFSISQFFHLQQELELKLLVCLDIKVHKSS